MKIKRRNFLKGIAGAGVGVAASPLLTGKALASEVKKLKPNHVGMLYDATKCIGCKSCEVACKKANNMPIEYDPAGIYDAPRDLSEKTLNIIKLYKGPEGTSFVKRQCMHCVDPNCVSGCPTSALNKTENGIVTYDKDACCGCRYCQMNCPFNIPKFEFNDFYGEIKKCELCRTTSLIKDGQPACTAACPTGAVIFGTVTLLLAEAKQRLKDSPGDYIDHVYGEFEGGGTSVLYLSKIPFEKLGLPNLPDYSQASLSEGIQHTLYQGLIAPAVIYAGLAAIAFKNRSGKEED
ncbi:MAG: hydrogenase 2 operon protein HybA [Deltaproteobacteria bacterium]|jgi:Fe-S-cluster-containing dehydrogenase component|nr:hydrogenase 2 operon protein HybA [Deltaproteobacteria bacterium]MBT4640179.1 hydrogenase 2 operon protein HybA [Deltaproteobacteria bacterium]MBT6499793.1 hydrogenase 2 operon protein HybA [Deltaproteobacteria bacterium]MBT6614120.1 hydrogenase 2 operon protein HybA [Deltaproteobacteria bacterium]MBT7151810.1 hydrogenase 2 operon protein HybA [Deltaproteobacteria bacterium]